MNIKTTKIYKFMKNNKNLKNLSDDIIDLFISEANKENIEYSFDIQKGTGKIKNKKANTFFHSDISIKYLYLNEFKKLLFNEDLKNIVNNDEKQLISDTDNYLLKIGKRIIKNNTQILKKIIRQIVLPESREEDIPLKNIEITKIEIMDYSSIPEPSKYLYKIGVVKGKEISPDTKTKLMQDIQDKQIEFNKTAQLILKEEKERNNPLYNNITEIEQKEKYLNELNISFFVDYSLSRMPC
jgi:hypothetical protein